LQLWSAADFVSGQRILSPVEGILPDLTKRDKPIFTGLTAVKVMLRPVTSREGMSSSQRHRVKSQRGLLDGL
jgi:hypothetical protein